MIASKLELFYMAVRKRLFFSSYRPCMGPGGTDSLTWPLGKTLKFFYFPYMIKFANSEFLLAIRGPKLAWRGLEDKFFKHKIGSLFFYLHPWNALE